MLQGVLYAVAYIFVYGLRWILPSLVLVGLISFFDYSISASKRLNLFMVNWNYKYNHENH